MTQALPAPVGLLAELTHRCPLSCPYCSNPLELENRNSELETAVWLRVLQEASALGILHVHLSGGEPALRRDIAELVAQCARLGLYRNLITSGVGRAGAVIADLAAAGLDHVQLSIQGAGRRAADVIAGLDGAHAAKVAFAEKVSALGLPLTVNLVVHRGNVRDIGAVADLAVGLGARRLEVAHTQYHGWALVNRAALMPSADDVRLSLAAVEAVRDRHAGRLVVDFVAPDHIAPRVHRTFSCKQALHGTLHDDGRRRRLDNIEHRNERKRRKQHEGNNEKNTAQHTSPVACSPCGRVHGSLRCSGVSGG